jgi:hypothetical protein
VIGRATNSITRITPNAFSITSDGRSPGVRISELGISTLWKVNFQTRLETLLKDEDKFPRDTYTYEETIVEIFVERSRQRGLKKRFNGRGVN